MRDGLRSAGVRTRQRFAPPSFDAAFGMLQLWFGSQAAPNCLLHVPRAEFDAVLASIRDVLAPAGLFYWGQYGGREFQGVYAEDTYRPKRFFSWLTDEQIQQAAARRFEMVDFRSIPLGSDGWAYQAMVLRRP